MVKWTTEGREEPPEGIPAHIVKLVYAIQPRQLPIAAGGALSVPLKSRKQ
jgi:hypothetical protein